jgi:hypothetical protein
MEPNAQWSSKCDLCRGLRVIDSFDGEPVECTWCKAVRLKWGGYSYPITKSNAHLFAHQQPASDEHLLRQAAEAREVMLRAWQWMADNEKYVFAASESAWKQMALIAPDLRAAEAALAAALRQRIGRG